MLIAADNGRHPQRWYQDCRCMDRSPQRHRRGVRSLGKIS